MLRTSPYPKRKRASVTYYEDGAEGSESDQVDVFVEANPSGKVCLDTDKRVGHQPDSLQKTKTSGEARFAKPLPKRKIFPFMALPPELKNAIYALVLTDVCGIHLASKTKQYRRVVQRVSEDNLNMHRYSHSWRCHNKSPPSNTGSDVGLANMVPNILLLNREICNEASPVLYAGNCFIVEDTTALHAFLANIGAKNRGLLADVTVKGWGYTKAHKSMNHPGLTMLADTNLARFCLDCNIIFHDVTKRVAKQIFRDGFHWIEAMATRNGIDAAVAVIEVSEENLSLPRYISEGTTEAGCEDVLKEFRAELKKLWTERSQK